jgi:hypothetical protein
MHNVSNLMVNDKFHRCQKVRNLTFFKTVIEKTHQFIPVKFLKDRQLLWNHLSN